MVFVLASDGSALAHVVTGGYFADDTPDGHVSAYFDAATALAHQDYLVDPPRQMADALARLLRDIGRIDARVDDRRREEETARPDTGTGFAGSKVHFLD